MISKAKARFIKSLQVKKYRQAEQCFLVQGAKAVTETLHSDFDIVLVAGTDAFFTEWESPRQKSIEQVEVSVKELTDLGSVETNDAALAVVKMKPRQKPRLPANDFALVLDDIRDPGNLGTIIRTADWYGVKNIIASPETADVYSPKVINATMGSFLRVNFFYEPLQEFLTGQSIPVYGTFLTGEDVHTISFGKSGLIVIGNESNGISPAVKAKVTKRITIPTYGKAESLNASVATGIILDNVRRTGRL
ncbi:MAG: RNA methyltransferase [Cyclobacteriaceae bacterium]|nr:RNA methyltransferase [Cyclobacteriaceae bacterium]